MHYCASSVMDWLCVDIYDAHLVGLNEMVFIFFLGYPSSPHQQVVVIFNFVEKCF